MRLFSALATPVALLLAGTTHAEPLVGYGTSVYKNLCAEACRFSVPTALDCPGYKGMNETEISQQYPSAACFAQDDPYLTSVAWCIHQTCENDTKSSSIDEFWESDIFYGATDPGIVVKYTYYEALQKVDAKHPPKPMDATELTLNRTVSITHDVWLGYYNAVYGYSIIAKNEAMYSLLVFLAGAVAPVGLSLLRILPWPVRLRSKFYAYFVDPPVVGKRHNVPVFGLAMVPTRGQTIFIIYLLALNGLAAFQGYPRFTPNSFYPDRTYELTRHIANRLGMLALTNFPLVILYAGRNNMLMWVTNWSHSTFLLIHRWLAVIVTMQACLHSAIWLHLVVSEGYYTESAQTPYWYYGIIATLSFSLLTPLSALPIRIRWYEIFLIGHIFLAVLAMVGAWYHIKLIYDGKEGYNIWLFVAMAIWGFDRLMRLVRVGKHGVKKAYITKVDDEYIRVDIPGVDAHGYCYAYFPTLSWRMWENHPFSIVGLNPGHPKATGEPLTSSSDSHSESERPGFAVDPATNKELGITTRTCTMATQNPSQHGITLFIRPHSGLTKLLTSKAGVEGGVYVLIEGTYGPEGRTSAQGNDIKFAPTPQYPNVLCIAGGVGVTAVLPALHGSLSLYENIGSTKLYWGIRNRSLVDAVEGMLVGQGDSTKAGWGHIQPHITVGSRLNVREILEKELAQVGGRGTTVIVCGPLAMCDEVRYNVAALARHGAIVRLMEETLTW